MIQQNTALVRAIARTNLGFVAKVKVAGMEMSCAVMKDGGVVLRPGCDVEDLQHLVQARSSTPLYTLRTPVLVTRLDWTALKAVWDTTIVQGTRYASFQAIHY